MKIDLEEAYECYEDRFVAKFGKQPVGAFVKFGNYLVQRLGVQEFDERLGTYLDIHGECRRLISTGATINDAVMMEFEEAAAWVAIQAPNLLDMFQGELGDPRDEVNKKRSTV